MVMARAGRAAPAAALVHDHPELALRAHDARPQARALSSGTWTSGASRASTAEAELIAAIFALLDARRPRARRRARCASTTARCSRRRCARACCATRPEAFAPLCVVVDKLDKIGARRGGRAALRPGRAPCSSRAPTRASVVALLGAREPRRRGAARRAAGLARARANCARLFDLLAAYGVARSRRLRRLGRARPRLLHRRRVRGLRRRRASCARCAAAAATTGCSRRSAGRPHAGGRLRLRRRRDRRAARRPRPAPGSCRADSTTVVFALGEAAARGRDPRSPRELRAAGRAVELVLGERRPKRVLADADKAGARRGLPDRPRRSARAASCAGARPRHRTSRRASRCPTPRPLDRAQPAPMRG